MTWHAAQYGVHTEYIVTNSSSAANQMDSLLIAGLALIIGLPSCTYCVLCTYHAWSILCMYAHLLNKCNRIAVMPFRIRKWYYRYIFTTEYVAVKSTNLFPRIVWNKNRELSYKSTQNTHYLIASSPHRSSLPLSQIQPHATTHQSQTHMSQPVHPHVTLCLRYCLTFTDTTDIHTIVLCTHNYPSSRTSAFPFVPYRTIFNPLQSITSISTRHAFPQNRTTHHRFPPPRSQVPRLCEGCPAQTVLKGHAW